MHTIGLVCGVQAAALLKRAEGIVTLIVCNPNKKDDKKEETSKTPKAEKKGNQQHKKTVIIYTDMLRPVARRHAQTHRHTSRFPKKLFFFSFFE